MATPTTTATSLLKSSHTALGGGTRRDNESPEVADNYNNLGNTHLAQARHKAALNDYQKALAIYLKVYGDMHPKWLIVIAI